mgnify:CR=1 FL=1
MELYFKVAIDDDGGRVMGDGIRNLLTYAEELGSLSAAAREMGMSYRQAWQLVNDAERRLGTPLLLRQTGGLAGGGSRMTPEAQQLVERYDAFRSEAEALVRQVYDRYFTNRGDAP